MTLITETTTNNYINDMKYNIKTYYLQIIGYDYSFDYLDLNENKKLDILCQ